MPNTTATTTANTNERDIVMLVTWRERREREEEERESESARVFLEPTSRDVPHALSIGRNEKERFTRTHAHTITTHNADSSPQRSTKGRINAHEKERGREPRQRTNTWSSEQESKHKSTPRSCVCSSANLRTSFQERERLARGASTREVESRGARGLGEKDHRDNTRTHTTTWTRGGRRGGRGGKKQESARATHTEGEGETRWSRRRGLKAACRAPFSPAPLLSVCVCVCGWERQQQRTRRTRGKRGIHTETKERA